MCAAAFGHHQIAALLMAKGADVNAVDDDQCTALHHICVSGDKTSDQTCAGMLRLLLAQPLVDCNLLDKLGCTPIQLAIVCGQMECIRVLAGDHRVELDNVKFPVDTTDTTTRLDSGSRGDVL